MLMALKKKSSSETWSDSLWFILRWTVVITPFWFVPLPGILRGTEIRMGELGAPIPNAYLYYASYAIMIASPTVGLVFSVFLRRKHWPAWAVFIGGIAAAIASLFVGSGAFVGAYSIGQ